MRWLREHGLIATYDDYGHLPQSVLDDARLVMDVEATVAAERRRERERDRG